MLLVGLPAVLAISSQSWERHHHRPYLPRSTCRHRPSCCPQPRAQVAYAVALPRHPLHSSSSCLCWRCTLASRSTGPSLLNTTCCAQLFCFDFRGSRNDDTQIHSIINQPSGEHLLLLQHCPAHAHSRSSSAVVLARPMVVRARAATRAALHVDCAVCPRHLASASMREWTKFPKGIWLTEKDVGFVRFTTSAEQRYPTLYSNPTKSIMLHTCLP